MLRYSIVSGGPAIILTDDMLAVFDRYRQRSHRDKEAGGQLFAKFEGTETVIVDATVPSLLDRRNRTRFEPNQWLQQREIRAKRDQGLHFVGDWHSHPEAVPRPSYVDLHSMRECFACSMHDLRNFVLIVVGTAPAPTGLYVGLVGSKIVRLRCETGSLDSTTES